MNGKQLVDSAKEMLEKSTEAIKQGKINDYISALVKKENNLHDEWSNAVAEVEYITTLDGIELEAYLEQQIKEKK
jgi:hypothetical protein